MDPSAAVVFIGSEQGKQGGLPVVLYDPLRQSARVCAALPSSSPSSSPEARCVPQLRQYSCPAFVVLTSPREVQCGYNKKNKNTTKTGLAVALSMVPVKKWCGYEDRSGGA